MTLSAAEQAIAERGLQRKIESIKKHAHKTWEWLRDHADEHRIPLTSHPKLGEGYIYPVSIGGTIRRVSRETTGHDCDKQRVDYVRQFLKASHNVVAVEKVAEYEWRVFVRKDWNPNDTTVPLVLGQSKTNEQMGSRTERRLTPDEAGETREPAPVEVRRLEESSTRRKLQGEHSVLGEQQAMIVRIIGEAGGHLHAADGLMNRLLLQRDPRIEKASVSTSIRALEERGWVLVTMRNQRRMSDVRFTGAGWEGYRNLSRWRQTRHVLLDHLKTHGRVTKERGHRSLSTTLAEEFGVLEARVGNAIRELLEDEEIEIEMSSGGGVYHSAWIPSQEDPVERPKRRSAPPVAEEDGIRSRRADATEEMVESHRSNADSVLANEVMRRLSGRAAEIESLQATIRELSTQPKSDPTLAEKLDLIRDIVAEVESGKCPPLKALADIGEAVKL